MKRLILKKLIVISQSEARSLEVPFSSGLNIILGGNKTGKSSVIKSIFISLGCECPKVESDWKKLISTYILLFTYGEKDYCITRESKQFCLFQKHSNRYSCLIETEHFHEYSNCLMKILQINMPCVDNQGKTFNVTPPLLFRFQYVDQDEGWRSIGEAFTNTRYIKNWKGNTNKFVCGYLDNSYYELKAQQEQLKIQKDELKRELLHNQQFVSRVSSYVQIACDLKSPEEIAEKLVDLLAHAEVERESQFELKAHLGVIENQIFMDTRKLELARTGLHESEKDIKFAMLQPSTVCCPICGAKYENSIESQLSISCEHSMAEKLIRSLEEELSRCKSEHSELLEKYSQISTDINEIERQICQSKQMISYSSFYKNEGKQELYESCTTELERLQCEIDKKLVSYAKLDDQISNLKSKQRSREIRQQLSSYCAMIADLIAIPKTFIKLNDFVQSVNRSGSDTPRLVYMYQSALFLYNLERTNSPFNFFVVDTPNQQGQDESNLQKIYDSLKLFQSNEGQVILGTERVTGYEDTASSIIILTEKRRCLTQEHYEEHLDFYEVLHREAIRWSNEQHTENRQLQEDK
jgi:hypothetical protein